MIPYQKEKIENAICFFASEHQKRTKKPLYQTFLYKYLALFEFQCIKKFGRPPLELKYLAMDKGPVPIKIYSRRESYETPCFVFKKISPDQFIVIPKGSPNLDYFPQIEQLEIKRLVEIYADKFVKADDMIEASHQSIKAWRETYAEKPNSPIDYQKEFDRDLEKKPREELTVAEESFLIYKALEKAGSR